MMWTAEYAHDTTQNPAALWQVLRDIDGWGSWNAGIEAIALDGPLAVGTTFRMTPPGESELTSTIAELEENRLLTDVTEMGDLVVRVEHRLEPSSSGGTRIVYRIEVTGPAEAEVGAAVSADFPEVMAALALAATTIPTR